MLGETPSLMVGWFLWLFAGAGLFCVEPTPAVPGSATRPRNVRFELMVLYFAFIQWAIVLPVVSPAPRYLMTFVVAVSLWSARGMAIVGGMAAGLPRTRWLRFAPVTAMALLMLFHATAAIGGEYLGPMPEQPIEYKIAGRWMQSTLEPGLILTRKPQVGYYAGMPTTGPALDDTVEAALARGREAKARYLVVDERYTAQLVPGLRTLLDPANAPPGLRLISEDLSPYPGARVVIYEFVAP